MPLLANLALLATWAIVHVDALQWLGRAWQRDEGQLHLALAVLAAAWVLSRAQPGAVLRALRQPLRPALLPSIVASGAAAAAALGPDLHTLHAGWMLVSGWGLYGLFVEPTRWRRSAGPALLLAALIPVTGHLDVLLGYPLRRALAVTAAALTGGVDAGTVLTIDGRFAHVDLPCSGVRGLWSTAVLLLGACVAWGRRLGPVPLLAVGLAVGLQLLQNLVRVTMLVALTGIDPLLADIMHLPLGVLGFVLALAGPLALVAVAPAAADLRRAPKPRSTFAAPAMLLVLGATVLLERPPSELPSPSPVVAAPSSWDPLAIGAAEAAFLSAHGAVVTKARHPATGAQVAMISSRSWLAHHVPEQCHEAGGWTLDGDHAASMGGHLVRVARAHRDGESATAVWWFRSADQITDDHTVRIRAGWQSDAPWVLVSLLLPGRTDAADPDLARLVADLDHAALAALETP